MVEKRVCRDDSSPDAIFGRRFRRQTFGERLEQPAGRKRQTRPTFDDAETPNRGKSYARGGGVQRHQEGMCGERETPLPRG